MGQVQVKSDFLSQIHASLNLFMISLKEKGIAQLCTHLSLQHMHLNTEHLLYSWYILMCMYRYKQHVAAYNLTPYMYHLGYHTVFTYALSSCCLGRISIK